MKIVAQVVDGEFKIQYVTCNMHYVMCMVKSSWLRLCGSGHRRRETSAAMRRQGMKTLSFHCVGMIKACDGKVGYR